MVSVAWAVLEWASEVLALEVLEAEWEVMEDMEVEWEEVMAVMEVVALEDSEALEDSVALEWVDLEADYKEVFKAEVVGDNQCSKSNKDGANNSK
jgi:hypothetical protein